MGGTRTFLVVVIAGACLSAATPAAACFRHTFEACPDEATSAYTLALDRKTGRTWLAEPREAAGTDEKLAELAAAAAKNRLVGPFRARAGGRRRLADARRPAKADPSPRN
jgi:hypothetical protein